VNRRVDRLARGLRRRDFRLSYHDFVRLRRAIDKGLARLK
jgi:hypothetical protein